MVADCTNDSSLRVLNKLGYEEKVSRNYKEFEFEGHYPFQDLKGA